MSTSLILVVYFVYFIIASTLLWKFRSQRNRKNEKNKTKPKPHHFYFYKYDCCCCLGAKSCPSFATPWTIAHQAPLSMEFPRQEYRSGLLFPAPGDPLNPGIKSVCLALAGGFFTTEPKSNLFWSLKIGHRMQHLSEGSKGRQVGSGGDGERWGSDRGSRGSLNEQIALVLMRLQEDMQNVLQRLHKLEMLAASQVGFCICLVLSAVDPVKQCAAAICVNLI